MDTQCNPETVNALPCWATLKKSYNNGTWEWGWMLAKHTGKRIGLSHSGLRLLAFRIWDTVTLAVKGVDGHKGQLFNDCRLLLSSCSTTNWWPESINSTIIGGNPLLPCPCGFWMLHVLFLFLRERPRREFRFLGSSSLSISHSRFCDCHKRN